MVFLDRYIQWLGCFPLPRVVYPMHDPMHGQELEPEEVFVVDQGFLPMLLLHERRNIKLRRRIIKLRRRMGFLRDVRHVFVETTEGALSSSVNIQTSDALFIHDLGHTKQGFRVGLFVCVDLQYFNVVYVSKETFLKTKVLGTLTGLYTTIP